MTGEERKVKKGMENQDMNWNQPVIRKQTRPQSAGSVPVDELCHHQGVTQEMSPDGWKERAL